MRGYVAAWVAALALLAPFPAAAQLSGSNMPMPAEGFEHLAPGEPRSDPGEALRRDKFDEAIARMFASTDTDRDGMLTLAELRAVIETRKEAAIRGRFQSIDTDRNQSVSFAEFNQWQRGLGSAVLSDAAAAAAGTTLVSEDVRPTAERGPGGAVLARLVAPLNATLLVAAHTDNDAGASLAEIAAYEGQRFDTADGNKDGWVTDEELPARAPRR
jgi:hypothetical protein